MEQIGLENLVQLVKELIYFPISVSVDTAQLSCFASTHGRAHVSRTNYELKGINRGTHCKINDLFRIEIMAAAYSRMHIPDVKRASCEMSDLRPFRLRPHLNINT
jgi:hypothetical protein